MFLQIIIAAQLLLTTTVSSSSSSKKLNEKFLGTWKEDISKRGDVQAFFESFHIDINFTKDIIKNKVPVKVSIKSSGNVLTLETKYGSGGLIDKLDIDLSSRKKSEHDFHLFGGSKPYDYELKEDNIKINVYDKKDKNKVIVSIVRELTSDKEMKTTLKNLKTNVSVSTVYKKQD